MSRAGNVPRFWELDNAEYSAGVALTSSSTASIVIRLLRSTSQQPCARYARRRLALESRRREEDV